MTIGSLTFQLKMKDQGTSQGTTTQHENGYIQGFKDRYEGLQPRYKDINENTKQWYDFYFYFFIFYNTIETDFTKTKMLTNFKIRQ